MHGKQKSNRDFSRLGSHFFVPAKVGFVPFCEDMLVEEKQIAGARRVAMLSLSVRFSTDVSRLMSHAQLAPPTAAIAQTVYHTFTTVITHKLSAL